MPTKITGNQGVDKWHQVAEEWRASFPHLTHFLTNTSDFGEFRLKARDDGTVLAIAKGFDASGTPVVCFGVGYDPILSVLAIDRTIQGGHWRVDKPWQPANNGK